MRQRSGWVLLLRSLSRKRKLLAQGIAGSLVWTAARVSVPLLVGLAIDRGLEKHRISTLLWYAGAIAVVGVVQGVSGGVRRYHAMEVAYGVETDLRHRLFAHLQRLHFAFHDQAQTGQLMSRSASDLQQVSELVANGPISVASVVTGIVVATVLLVTNPLLAAVALAPLAVMAFYVVRFTHRMQPAAMQLQQELGELATVAEEAITGVRAVKGFGAERGVMGSMRDRAGSVYEKALRTIALRSGFTPLVTLLPAAGLAGVLWLGGHLVLKGQLQYGQLVEVCAYVQLLVGPLTQLGYVAGVLPRALASCERVDEILSLAPVITDPPRAVSLPAEGGEVRFEGVSFSYGSEAVLDGFDLTVRDGESVALVGATGSGKTTVARLLPRFYDVDAGRVTIAGTDIKRVQLADLRRAVGIVFEDTFLFSDTIRANIAFAEPEASGERVRRAAALAGAEFIEQLPDGYDTLLGERGLSLSGG
ncbi:MAG TPA: ABC transporter ATP-binding protein, partial [Acidimicrobiales bacterium]|nr:ABC transporter ATP-binding protein [Acidimicrobiales bacterium]